MTDRFAADIDITIRSPPEAYSEFAKHDVRGWSRPLVRAGPPDLSSIPGISGWRDEGDFTVYTVSLLFSLSATGCVDVWLERDRRGVGCGVRQVGGC